jgi:hypothetical protein
MTVAQEHAAAPLVTFGAMPMSVSVPEGLNWHMILDHELSQLTRPESGVIGSIGFVALGAFLGLIPAAFSGIEKLRVTADTTTAATAFTMSDLSAVVVCGGSLVLAVFCLIIFGVVHYRNRGLASTIRARSKRDFTFSNEEAASQ